MSYDEPDDETLARNYDQRHKHAEDDDHGPTGREWQDRWPEEDVPDEDDPDHDPDREFGDAMKPLPFQQDENPLQGVALLGYAVEAFRQKKIAVNELIFLGYIDWARNPGHFRKQQHPKYDEWDGRIDLHVPRRDVYRKRELCIFMRCDGKDLIRHLQKLRRLGLIERLERLGPNKHMARWLRVRTHEWRGDELKLPAAKCVLSIPGKILKAYEERELRSQKLTPMETLALSLLYRETDQCKQPTWKNYKTLGESLGISGCYMKQLTKALERKHWVRIEAKRLWQIAAYVKQEFDVNNKCRTSRFGHLIRVDLNGPFQMLSFQDHRRALREVKHA